MNSLVGSRQDDRVGSAGIKALANGNYVVGSTSWSTGTAPDVGASTWCNGTTGCVGEISSTNSLIGSTLGNDVGMYVIELANGNYVVLSPHWDGTFVEVGATTWCSGATGCTGVVSAANSLVGSTLYDSFQSVNVTPLTNGNYVVSTPNWDGTGITDIGAVTWCSGTGGCTGAISPANSLIGSTENDRVGDVIPLTNGNYVVASGYWDGAAADTGAVTFCSGTTGCPKVISSTNSLVGSIEDEQIGAVTPLTNGNYVVTNSGWSGTAPAVGAVTWCSGAVGCVGAMLPENSLIGSTEGDLSFAVVEPLPNGNYVVSSIFWDSTSAANVGAVTWCNGTTGCSGMVVSEANSLVGSILNDCVGGCGGGGITALPNSNYVVASPGWDGSVGGLGAVTLCTEATGCTGVVSKANSLVGSTFNDGVGNNGVYVMTNGNFVVSSSGWDGTAANVGAVTWCSGVTGCPGMVVSAANSLVGSTSTDNIGNGGITALTGGGYAFRSNNWDNPTGPVTNAGAVSYGDATGGVVGPVSMANSVLGTINTLMSPMNFVFNHANQTLIVGRARSNIVTIFLTFAATPAISGTVTYGNAIPAATRFVSNVSINSTTGSPAVSTTTGALGPTAGQYLLNGFGSGTYSLVPVKTGGVNGITSFDAAKIAQHVASINILTGNQLIVADVSGNGTLSSFDAGQIARYVASAAGFGSSGSWIFNPINRTYPSVTSNITGEDYSALLMGEVSGNWTNTGARPSGLGASVARTLVRAQRRTVTPLMTHPLSARRTQSESSTLSFPT